MFAQEEGLPDIEVTLLMVTDDRFRYVTLPSCLKEFEP